MSSPSAFRWARALSLAAALMVTVSATTTASQTSPAFESAWRAGTPTVVTGLLTVIHADDFENRRAELVHFIRDERTGQPFQVRFDRGAPGNLRSDARVTLSGRARASELYVLSDDVTDSTTAPLSTGQTAASSTLAVSGDQHTLVMVANFIDTAVACSVADVDNVMFSNPSGYSVAALYRDNSRGQLSFSGDVVGPFTIDARATDACNPSAWGLQAEAAAAASGVDPASYARKIYVMPDNSCPASGYGTTGGSPSRAWVFACSIPGVYAHEIGHNLGMDHASDLTSEFGDWTDPMAVSTNQLRGLNAPHRQQLGWLAADRLLQITQSGYYDVAPLSIDPATATAPQAIAIRKPDSGEYYYLSYRISEGFDNNISGWYRDHRLSVHRYKGDGSSTNTYLVAGLADGEHFVDQANGDTVTMVSHSVTHATARVEFSSPCPVATPSVSLTPRDQRGPAGAGAKYVISVSNTDGSSCPPSTIALKATVPGGWDAAVSPASLTVAAGAGGSAELTVRSTSSASPGTYGVSVDLSDAATPSHGTLASGSYTVEGDTVAPSAPSGLIVTTNQKLKQIDLSWNASSDNVGVTSYSVVRNGAAVGLAKTTKWADSTWSPNATYTYSVVAYDQAGNASPQSNSVTIKLNGDGGGGGGGGGGKKP
jgi:hypothetical protein